MTKKQATSKKTNAKSKTPRTKQPEVEEFMEIGGSPTPGITLRQVLRGHTAGINRIAWSPDGRYLASPSKDKTIRIWDVEHGECIKVLTENKETVTCVMWSPDQSMLASSSDHGSVHIWGVDEWHVTKILEAHESSDKTPKSIYGIAWSSDGKKLLIGSESGEIMLWDDQQHILQRRFINTNKWISFLKFLDQKRLFVGFVNTALYQVWDIESNKLIYENEFSSAHSYSLSKSPTGNNFAVAQGETIKIFDSETYQLITSIEGHTNQTVSTAYISSGNVLVSKSMDQTVRFWKSGRWGEIARLNETCTPFFLAELAFHPNQPILVTSSHKKNVIFVWGIDVNTLFRNNPQADSITYTTAKLVLVGDSGVGKTGLGWRLSHNEFKEHSSTHGQQFWVVPELKKTREDGTECEAVLWDLAGQPDYRLIHSLYLDDVDTALVLFDPTNRQEPLSGVNFWLNQLKGQTKDICNTVLIGARTDRGTSTLTESEIQEFCKRNNVTGGYIATSAKEGKGLPQLMEMLKEQIPWDALPATITTTTFKSIKEYVLSLKEKPKRRKVLLQPSELRKQLEKTDKKWKFSDAEMMTAVRHLENHGYVKVLHGSNGEENILLSPDILANLASSIVLEARRSPRGLGVLEEARLLRGEYQFPELNKISEIESKILLDAAAVLFLEHNLCFRENFNQQIFLVFPSLINEKRPIDEGINLIEGETYQVKGAVENLYASMVVLLGYTNTFVRTHQWQNHAQYEMGKGEVCGFQQINYDDGNIELVLNYGEQTPDPVRLMFRGLFERFLSRRELEIARYQTVTCKNCSSLLARNVVLDQLNKGKKFTYCNECGKKVTLPSPEPLTRLSPKEEVEIDTQQIIANYRTAFEAALVRVKGLLRDKKKKKKPTCFISYAWGISENERWVLQFAKDLRNADIDVLLDRWDSPIGSNLDWYIDRILSSDFVIPVGTPELRKKYDTKKADPVVAAELKLINLRVRQPTEYGDTVLPVLLTGNAKTSLTPQLQPLVSVDFREAEYYFRKLFDMIWRLYDLPFDNPLLEELQESMTPQKRN